ncbi:MAG: cyclic nucleotide-binding domain-containing protein [Actinomycetota bacterium]|nr:cyclic nucleotide-binding domain-containing protein [Actinomycetota bacterium]
MRIEKSVTSVTWIPSEAISGMPKLPFEMGVSHYDDPPPDQLESLEELHKADAFREANELKAWIEVDDDGRITDHGYSGEGLIGVTRIKLGPRELAFAAVQYPLIQAEPEVGDGWVRFVQSAGGHMGLPAPRRVSGKPFFRIQSASAWTTLMLTIHADGKAEGKLGGASTFPRHWLYDNSGKLLEKSGTIDFERWYREAHGEHTPWGAEDTPAMATAVESELERELSQSIMRSDAKLDRRKLDEGEALTEQGQEGNELYLLLDGVLSVEVNGEPVADVGPGAILGERALLEGGTRTATLRAKTPVRVVVVPSDAVDESALPELAAGRRREES